jgi:hypothetical protein
MGKDDGEEETECSNFSPSDKAAIFCPLIFDPLTHSVTPHVETKKNPRKQFYRKSMFDENPHVGWSYRTEKGIRWYRAHSSLSFCHRFLPLLLSLTLVCVLRGQSDEFSALLVGSFLASPRCLLNLMEIMAFGVKCFMRFSFFLARFLFSRLLLCSTHPDSAPSAFKLIDFYIILMAESGKSFCVIHPRFPFPTMPPFNRGVNKKKSRASDNR